MWIFKQKPTHLDPDLGPLTFAHRQWTSGVIATGAGKAVVSLEGDAAGPDPACLSLARTVLQDAARHVAAAMAHACSDPQAREFMAGQGRLLFDGFSINADGSFHVDLALSEWEDASINVVFVQGAPREVLLSG